MQKVFKIFLLKYSEQEVFSGYSDGYGKEFIDNPVFHGINDHTLNGEYDTELEAEKAIEKYGEKYCQYIIQPIYKVID